MAELVYQLGSSVPGGTRGHVRWAPGAAPESLVIELDVDGNGLADDYLVPGVTLLGDPAPQLVSVHQWGKGSAPDAKMTFDTGDPFGRLVAVLFSEEIQTDDLKAPENFALPDHRIVSTSPQPDDRLVFVMLDKPVGPFVARSLTVHGARDLAGNAMAEQTSAVVPDPDRGVGGVVSGTVRTPDGTPVPFASIKYGQMVSCTGCPDAYDWPQELVISDFVADAEGHYQLDFVLSEGSLFSLHALDPLTGHPGRVSTEIRWDGQQMGLDIIIRGYGSIVGHLLDEQGQPVAGGDPWALGVFAQNLSTGESAVSWVDADGYFAFPRSLATAGGATESAPQLPVGNVVLRVYRASDQSVAVTTANIPAAGAVVTQDLFLTPTMHYGTVAGRVVEADGHTPAANILVQVKAPVLSNIDLYGRTYSTVVVGAVNTDALGRFEVDSVPTGDIEVYAFRQSTYEQTTAKAFLSANETTSLTLVFPGSGARIEGIVVDALGAVVAGAKVVGGPTLTQSDALGRFEIPYLPLGTFTIYAQAPDSQGTGSATVSIQSPTDVLPVVIKLEPMGSISGTLRDANGAVVVGQEVQAWTTYNGNYGVIGSVYTTTTGAYQFKSYPVGHYELVAVTGNYGDGGKVETDIRYAGDVRQADVQFRGLGEVSGTVVQSNGTPAIADIVITRKVWRVLTQGGADPSNYYVGYVNQLSQVQGIGDDVQAAFRSGYQSAEKRWFLGPRDEPVNTNPDGKFLRSDILGPGGEVTGRFHFTGSITGGPFTVTVGSSFMSPATISSEIPKTTVPAQRIVDVGTITLVPSVGSVTGVVLMPDGVTPVGEGVAVRVKSLSSVSSSSGALPELTVTTGPDGRFSAPIVNAGSASLVADTLVPQHPALVSSDRHTDTFSGLNVRLYGSGLVAVPRGQTVDTRLRLLGVTGVTVKVVDADGVTPVPLARVTFSTASVLDSELDRSTVVSGIPGFVDQTADAGGVLTVFPVIEGGFSVSAAGQRPDPTDATKLVWSSGRADGSVDVNPPFGPDLQVTVQLDAIRTSAGTTVPVASFGNITGSVHRADGTPLSNPSEVTILASGVQIATT
ncbi:MAG TPA: carboxypeptidase-like regulatory domain-containing protein, partial [Acidimicrobiales bacterium]|nr:carboxypeptidase-like regulatory domain-containing protein [Acidimicrobiales bacterium]